MKAIVAFFATGLALAPVEAFTLKRIVIIGDSIQAGTNLAKR